MENNLNYHLTKGAIATTTIALIEKAIAPRPTEEKVALIYNFYEQGIIEADAKQVLIYSMMEEKHGF